MKRQLIIIIAMAAWLLCCKYKRITYTKYDPGLCYRIVQVGDGETVQPGEIVKMHMKQTYRDSLMNDNTDSLPYYQVHDSVIISKAAYELFSKVRKGDSIIVKALTDSVFKNQLPSFVKKGEWMYTHVYIREVFPAGYNYEQDLKNEMRKKNIPIHE